MEDDLLSAGLACLRGQWPIAMAMAPWPSPRAGALGLGLGLGLVDVVGLWEVEVVLAYCWSYVALAHPDKGNEVKGP